MSIELLNELMEGVEEYTSKKNNELQKLKNAHAECMDVEESIMILADKIRNRRDVKDYYTMIRDQLAWHLYYLEEDPDDFTLACFNSAIEYLNKQMK